MPDWQPIETAPKGGGAERTDDPAYVEPPQILLLFPRGERRVGHWDAYYAEGGAGAWESKGHGWIEPTSGEILALYYDSPTHWMPLPDLPQREGGSP